MTRFCDNRLNSLQHGLSEGAVALSYYMTAAREKIVPRVTGWPQPGHYCIGDDRECPGFRQEVLWRFDAKYQKNQVLVKFHKA